jgi:hypothetical protein
MEKEEQKLIQRTAQAYLEQLQGTGASFMFIGDEGNCFTLGGDVSSIAAQLMFAMIRYPLVKEIVKKCSKKFDKINKEMGDDLRNIRLQHLIEEYNKE